MKKALALGVLAALLCRAPGACAQNFAVIGAERFFTVSCEPGTRGGRPNVRVSVLSFDRVQTGGDMQ